MKKVKYFLAAVIIAALMFYGLDTMEKNNFSSISIFIGSCVEFGFLVFVFAMMFNTKDELF
jgi:hypothetical protein